MRKICVYTSSRAEYGLLRGVLQEIEAEPTLQLQILAGGMRLSPEFGMTIKEIEADGFKPDETAEILLSSDTPTVNIGDRQKMAFYGGVMFRTMIEIRP
jgi:UDP-N-acetylglucosamine 2-epimerase